MTSQTITKRTKQLWRQLTITIHLLPDIQQIKGNKVKANKIGERS